jgi:NTE family protein
VRLREGHRPARLGLALGGGAARGVAHVGVIRELEEAGMRPAVISGTSVGALLGALYAFVLDGAELEARTLEFLRSDRFRRERLDFLREGESQRDRGLVQSFLSLVKRGYMLGVSLTRSSFVSAEHFAENIAGLVPDIAIEELPLPFAATALDLVSGRERVLRSGRLREAVRASSAIPGLFPPVSRDGALLADGGWVDKVPALPAFDLGADVVMSVDVSIDLEEEADLRRGYDMMARATVCTEWALRRLQLGLADVVVRPEVSHIHWADFDRAEELVDLGRQAARRAVPELSERLRRQRRWGWLRSSPGARRARQFRAQLARLESEGGS